MSKKETEPFPYPELIDATFRALKKLGGAGSNEEILKEVINILSLTEEEINIPQENSTRTKLEYKLTWTRTFLSKSKIIENENTGFWIINSEYRKRDSLTEEEIKKSIALEDKNQRAKKQKRNQILKVQRQQMTQIKMISFCSKRKQY